MLGLGWSQLVYRKHPKTNPLAQGSSVCSPHWCHTLTPLMAEPLMAAPEPPAPAEGMEEEAAAEYSLAGLATAWEKDDIIRQRTLKEGNLLCWPNKKLTGVISFPTISANARVLDSVLRHHCPNYISPKTVHIDHLREQVRWAKVEITCWLTFLN